MTEKEKEKLMQAEEALFQKMVGYDYEEEKIIEEMAGGEVIKTKRECMRRHIPADSAMLMTWLKRRYPKRWDSEKEAGEAAGGVVILPEIKEGE
jgi:hypothetical protein